MINNEFYVFIAFILIGLLIGFVFDFFRILRKVYKTPDFITVLEDITFWVISGTILLVGIFILNGGKIRTFLFMGIVIGLLLYISFMSKFIVKYGIKIFKIVNYVIVCPIEKIIRKILFFLQKIVYNIKIQVKRFIFDFLKHNNIKKRRNS